MSRTRLALVPAALALALAGAGCGGGDDEAAVQGDAPAPAETSKAPQAASGPVAATIKDFVFEPKDIVVRKGQKITWTNEDTAPHDVVAPSGEFKSKILKKGEKFTFTAAKAGKIEYVCSIHPQMTGYTVTVSD